MNDPHTHCTEHASEHVPEQIAPVCGMRVPDGTEFRYTHADKTYFFCSHHCLEKFKVSPKRYTSTVLITDDRTNEGADLYTCPMHPEILRNEPGSCPICGMALEPRNPAVEEDNSELKDMTHRFWVSMVLSLPVFVMAMMADLVPDFTSRFIAFSALQWLEFARDNRGQTTFIYQ